MNLLLDIHLSHPYYRDGELQDVVFEAQPETQSMLDRFSILLRRMRGRLQLYCANEPLEMLQYLVQVNENKEFIFSVCGNKSNFFYITCLPENWVGEVLIDSGSVSNETSEYVKLKSHLSKACDSPHIVSIRIKFSDLLARIEDSLVPKYQVEFKVRHTYWYYYLCNRSNMKLREPVITNQDGVEFNTPEEVHGMEFKTLGFDSGKHQFPMSQSAVTVFSLVEQVSINSGRSPPRSKVFLRGLPTPEVDNLHYRVSQGERRIYSEMYVYV